MPKKILTLSDLVAFCESGHLQRFSANESGYQLCVQVPSTFEKSDSTSCASMLFGTVKLLHTNTNRNKSNVTYDAAKKCLDTIKYKPLLANFCEVDGVKDFTSHDFEINEDGSVTYLERQIGSFTSDKPTLEYDKETDRYYIYANVAIPREYTDAAEIIERKGGTKISAELAVNEMSYDATNHELVLNDIEVMGATCLGLNPETGEEVQEGMQGARLDITDFAIENNSVRYEQNNKLIETLEKLNNTLSNFNDKSDQSDDNSKKGGNNDLKLSELLEKYNVVIEDVVFDYENMTDEELESAFEEAFGIDEAFEEGEGEDGSEGGEPEVEESEAEEEPETEEEPEVEEEPKAEEEPETPEVPEPAEPEAEASADDDEVKKVEYSVEFNGTKKNFSVSLGEIIYALQQLVNDTYSELDNDWYCVDVYDSEKYVVMHGWNKSFRQSYKVRKDMYSLVGDRVEVFAKWLSEDEIAKLEEVQKNYSSVVDKLAKYESEPEKMEILTSKDYEFVAGTDEFAELLKEEVHFDLSLEDVRAKADEILLQYAKAGSLNFAATEHEEKKDVSKKSLFAIKKNTGRYGNLFSK